MTQALAIDDELNSVSIVKALAEPVDILGKIVEKMADGKQVFLNLNYNAQRTRKTLFEKQTEQKIVYTESEGAVVPGIEFVKENYKGNIEALKRHRLIQS